MKYVIRDVRDNSFICILGNVEEIDIYEEEEMIVDELYKEYGDEAQYFKAVAEEM